MSMTLPIRLRAILRLACWLVALYLVCMQVLPNMASVRGWLFGAKKVDATYLDNISDPKSAYWTYVEVTGLATVDANVEKVATSSRTKSESVSSRYYGLRVGKRLVICEYDSKDGEFPTTVRGIITPIPPELSEQLSQFEIRQGPIYNFYLKSEFLERPLGLGFLFIFSTIAIFILFKIGFVCIQIVKPTNHLMFARLAKWGDLDEVIKHVKQESRTPVLRGSGWKITKSYLIRSTPFHYDVLKLENVLWTYQNVAEVNINFIPFRQYQAIVVCVDGIIKLGASKKSTEGIVTYLSNSVPWAFCGYSESLNQAYDNHPNEFALAVAQRKQEMPDVATSNDTRPPIS